MKFCCIFCLKAPSTSARKRLSMCKHHATTTIPDFALRTNLARICDRKIQYETSTPRRISITDLRQICSNRRRNPFARGFTDSDCGVLHHQTFHKLIFRKKHSSGEIAFNPDFSTLQASRNFGKIIV